MKKTIIYMITVLICILLCSCERELRLNDDPELIAELEDNAKYKDLPNSIRGPAENEYCLENGHGTPILFNGVLEYHFYRCDRCSDIIEKKPHCDIKEEVSGTMVLKNGTFAVVTKKCGVCGVVVETKYIPYDHTVYKEGE